MCGCKMKMRGAAPALGPRPGNDVLIPEDVHHKLPHESMATVLLRSMSRALTSDGIHLQGRHPPARVQMCLQGQVHALC